MSRSGASPDTSPRSLAGDRMLVSFGDAEDVASGTVAAVTGWELAKIADPADDWAAIVSECPPDVVDDIRDGYRSVLIERADPHLVVRAHLAGELSLMRRLLNAVGAADIPLTTTIAGSCAASTSSSRRPMTTPSHCTSTATTSPSRGPVAATQRPARPRWRPGRCGRRGRATGRRLGGARRELRRRRRRAARRPPGVADGQGPADEAAELGATQPIDLAELDTPRRSRTQPPPTLTRQTPTPIPTLTPTPGPDRGRRPAAHRVGLTRLGRYGLAETPSRSTGSASGTAASCASSGRSTGCVIPVRA